MFFYSATNLCSRKYKKTPSPLLQLGVCSSNFVSPSEAAILAVGVLQRSCYTRNRQLTLQTLKTGPHIHDPQSFFLLATVCVAAIRETLYTSIPHPEAQFAVLNLVMKVLLQSLLLETRKSQILVIPHSQSSGDG
jgi:hypothetical protein